MFAIRFLCEFYDFFFIQLKPWTTGFAKFCLDLKATDEQNNNNNSRSSRQVENLSLWIDFTFD